MSDEYCAARLLDSVFLEVVLVVPRNKLIMQGWHRLLKQSRLRLALPTVFERSEDYEGHNAPLIVMLLLLHNVPLYFVFLLCTPLYNALVHFAANYGLSLNPFLGRSLMLCPMFLPILHRVGRLVDTCCHITAPSQ